MTQKASRLPTKTDRLLQNQKKVKDLYALNRLRITPRTIQNPSGGSIGAGGDVSSAAESNSLKSQGDTMVGPIAFFPVDVFIDSTTDPSNPSINIGEGASNPPDYSTYVLVTGGSPPTDLSTIFGAAFAGQMLKLQAIVDIVIKDAVANGSGNILTTTNNDQTLAAGSITEFMFDITSSPGGVQGAWRLASTGGSTSPGGDAKTGFMLTSTGSTQTVPSATQVILDVFDIPVIQDGVIVSTIDNSLTPLESGRYVFGFNLTLSADSNNTTADFVLIVNGTPLTNVNSVFLRGFGDNSGLYPTAPFDFIAGDVLTIGISHDKGVPVTFDFQECGFYMTKVESGGGSGEGATSLPELSDVQFPTFPIDNDVLTFNASSGFWENIPPQSGGMNTDMSNMISPTIPSVPLSMNLQNITGVNFLEFDSNGAKSITTLDNIFFNKSQQSIASIVGGINIKVNSDEEIIFETPNGIIAKFDEVNAADRRLEMQGNRISDVGKISFSPVFSTATASTSQIFEESGFNSLFYVAAGGSHVFKSSVTSEILLTIGNIVGGGGNLQDIGFMNFNANEINSMTRDGDMQLVYQSGDSGPADILMRSGGQLKSITDIGTGGGATNQISQGNSNVTVTDTGVGSITIAADGQSIAAFTNSIGIVFDKDLNMGGNDLKSTGFISPGSNGVQDIGSATLFYNLMFSNFHFFNNTNNFMNGDSGGLNYQVGTGDTHDFKTGGSTRMLVRNSDVSMLTDVEMNSNSINNIFDATITGHLIIESFDAIIEFPLSGAILDVNTYDFGRSDQFIQSTNDGVNYWTEVGERHQFVVDGVVQFRVTDEHCLVGKDLLIFQALQHQGATVGFFGRTPVNIRAP